jgi:hypothetical protein
MSYPFGASRVQSMLDRIGVPITVSGTTVNGLPGKEPAESTLEDHVVISADVIWVTVKAGSLPALDVGVAITVDGVAHKVTLFRPAAAGAFTVIACAPA